MKRRGLIAADSDKCSRVLTSQSNFNPLLCNVIYEPANEEISWNVEENRGGQHDPFREISR